MVEDSTKGKIALGVGCVVSFGLLLTACAAYHNWWPMFVLAFYIMIPLPSTICGAFRKGDVYSEEPGVYDAFGTFLSSALATSTFAFPLVLNHMTDITGGQVALVITANVVLFSSAGYFLKKLDDDSDGYMLA